MKGFLCFWFLISVCLSAGETVSGQHRGREWKLVRRHLDEMFTIDVPAKFKKPDTHADVNGGFFLDDSISIDYDYWQYAGTPNFLRDRNGKYSKKPDLACSGQGRNVLTTRKMFGQRLGYVQQCRLVNPNNGFHYLYWLTMPKAKVREVDTWGDGVFNLSISFNDRKLLPLARKIIYSLRFDRS
jgi:hypothetical protein